MCLSGGKSFNHLLYPVVVRDLGLCFFSAWDALGHIYLCWARIYLGYDAWKLHSVDVSAYRKRFGHETPRKLLGNVSGPFP